MPTEPLQATAVEQHGASSNLTLHLGDGAKNFQLIVIALFLSMAINLGLAMYAIFKASDASYHANQWEYWGEVLEARLLAHGFDAPPSPTKQARSK